MQFQVAPSILAADFLNLGKDIQMLNSCADLIHLDVMDGALVPNISFGFPVVDAVAGIATIPMDAHLMIEHPERYFERFAQSGVQMLSFHYEAAKSQTRKRLREVKALGMKAGLAINPDVPVSKLFPYIGEADFFLVMSVFAGFGGQKFIYETIDRIAALSAEIAKRGESTPIEVDGGVSASNAAALKEAGASIFVAGSSVFKASDPAKAVDAIRQA